MRKLALFAFGTGIGLLASTYLLPETAYVWFAAVVIVLGVFSALFLTGHTRLRFIIVLCGMLCAVGYISVYNQFKLRPAEELCRDANRLEFTVVAYPEQTAYGVRCEAKTGGVKTLLYLDAEDGEDLKPGDVVTAQVKLRPVTQDSNGVYYRSGGVLLKGYARDEVEICKAEHLAVKYYSAYAAKKLGESIDISFHKDTAGFMKALLIGDKSTMEAGIYDTLKNAGLAHIVAVSGLHISFLVAAISRIRMKRGITAALCISVLVFFAFMTGCTPSVLRAVIMASMLLIAPLMGRENDGITALALAFLITLAVNPYAIQSISLQLSYASVIGIFAFSGRICAFFRRERKGRLIKIIAESVGVSLSASVFTIPISACYFGQISLLAPISNLLTLWVVSFLFPLGLAVATIGIFLPTVGSFLGWILYIPGKYVLTVAKLISSMAFAQISSRSVPMICWLVFAYIVFGIMVFTRGWRRKWYIPVSAVISSLCIICIANAVFTDMAGFTFSVLDVGQGQAIVVTAGSKTAIIDAGGYGEGADTAVQSYLLSIGRKSADIMLLTHPHKDHAMYASDVLRSVEVGSLILPRSSDDDEIEEGIITTAIAENTEVYRLKGELEFELDGVRFRLFPPTSGKGNELCMAVLVSAGDYDILVTGDMPAAQEQALTELYDIGDVDLLLVGHHGSAYSTSQPFLDVTKPETAIISVGADNSYGHPREEVLERLEDIGAAIYRTDINGTITVIVKKEQVY